MTMVSIHSLNTLNRLEELINLNVTIHGDTTGQFFRQFIAENPASSNPEFHRFVLQDDTVVAGTSLVERVLMWHGSEISAGEIDLVGTFEEHRKKGHSGALMDNCFETMRAKKIPLSYLWGIPRFYERYHYYYGYPNYFTAYISIPKSCSGKWESGGTFRRASDGDFEAIKNIYKKYNQSCSGWMVRSDELWDYYFRLTMRNEKCGWWVAGDPVQAYAFVTGEKPIVKEIGIIGLENAELIDDPKLPVYSPPQTDPEQNSANAVMVDLVLGLFHEYSEIENLDIFHHPDMPVGKWLKKYGANVRSSEDIWKGSWAGMVRINDPMLLLSLMTEKFSERLADSKFFGYTGEISITSEIGGAMISIRDGDISVSECSDGTVNIPASVLTPIMTGYRGFRRYKNALPEIPEEIADVLGVLFPRDKIYMHNMIYIDEEIVLK